ncbi:hypothetical protein [Roseovarius autotrophicus]|uniref:hypothetical protein n=1 Tax=Roseovarius autotrophicus TaxID=2824121 RepID=UPI001B3855E8|nr:hypothetical protein [Roseovarius autotrophicus]
MKRSAIAYLADIPPKRFDLLAERGHLPFPKRVNGSYTFAEALQLRLMAMATSVDGFAGISPEDACSLVGNGLSWAGVRYSSKDPWAFVGLGNAVWITGAEFSESNRSVTETETWRAWFAGPIDELSGWLSEQIDPSKRNVYGLGNQRVNRVFSALNVTAAAYNVLIRADEMGITRDEP